MKFTEDYTSEDLRGIDTLYKRKADGEQLTQLEAQSLMDYENAIEAQRHEADTIGKMIASAGKAMIHDAIAYRDKLIAAYDELRKSQVSKHE